MGALVRDFTKWDDEPLSLGHFAETAVRAYNIAMTPPGGPVLIVCNAEIQGDPKVIEAYLGEPTGLGHH